MHAGSSLTLRPYQVDVDAAIGTALRSGGRGQLRMACGSGKTVVALTAVRQLCPAEGMAVLLFPSLALIRQTLRFFAQQGLNFDPLAVCSEKDVVDSSVDIADIPAPVTTDRELIAKWLGVRKRRGIVAATYASIGSLVSGMQAAGVQAAVMIADEAHHTAGRKHKRAARVHYDLPAERRLYLTATPRISRMGADAILSMDDEEIFGPVLYEYPFSRGIQERYLDNYRVAALGVAEPEILTLLQSNLTDGDAETQQLRLRTVLAQVALAKAAARWDLRRIIVYCPRVRDAQQFAATLPDTLRLLPADQRPTGTLTARAVDGEMPTIVREQHLSDLANPPMNGWTVLANAKCLTEGVDVPAVDAVLFSAPKRSTIDVVQAIGRALRPNPNGTGTSTVIVPLLLHDAPNLAAVPTADYDIICEVLDALRAHDEALIDEMNQARSNLPMIHAGTAEGDLATSPLPSRIELHLPDAYDHREVFSKLAIRVIQSTTSSWWESYGKAKQFREREGHLTPSKNHIEDGLLLNPWVNDARIKHRRRALPADQVAALDNIGIVWDPQADAFQRGLDAYIVFRTREGDMAAPEGHIEDGVNLRNWQARLRRSYKKGSLTQEQISKAEAAGIVWTRYETTSFEEMVDLLRAYRAREGNRAMPKGHVEDGVNVGKWVKLMQLKLQQGKVPETNALILNELGVFPFRKRNLAERFEANLEVLRAYHAREGNWEVPKGHVENESQLGNWLSNFRQKYRKGRAPKEQVKILKDLGVRLERISDA